ncbi:hypothetical protein E4U54_003812 [Claviceps lovelessii]|nr:hypothetical protein E4U54_003812 [Claviceps lovelessii]
MNHPLPPTDSPLATAPHAETTTLAHALHFVLTTLNSIANSGSCLETHLLRLVHLPITTRFRMFPREDVLPAPLTYPVTDAYLVAATTVLLIPYLVWRERGGRGGTVGFIVRPWLEGSRMWTKYLVMLARVWFCAACINMATAKYLVLVDPGIAIWMLYLFVVCLCVMSIL